MDDLMLILGSCSRRQLAADRLRITGHVGRYNSSKQHRRSSGQSCSQASQHPTALSQNGATAAHAGLADLALEFTSDHASDIFGVPSLYVPWPCLDLLRGRLFCPRCDTDERAPTASLLVYLFGLLFTDNL